MDFFSDEEAINNWHPVDNRKPGGKIIYNDQVIEICLLMRAFYQLAYPQTEGFVGSVWGGQQMGLKMKIPDYTPLARQAGRWSICLHRKVFIRQSRQGIVIAVDSTGLSVCARVDETESGDTRLYPSGTPSRTLICLFTPQSVHLCQSRQGIVIAVDSTGLSVCAKTECNRRKHHPYPVPGHSVLEH